MRFGSNGAARRQGHDGGLVSAGGELLGEVDDHALLTAEAQPLDNVNDAHAQAHIGAFHARLARRTCLTCRASLDRRPVYFGRDRASASAGEGAVLPYGDDPDGGIAKPIGRKTPAF